MSRTFIKSSIISLLLAVFLPLASQAQETDYKEYRRSSKKTEYFEISFDRHRLEITFRSDGSYISRRFLYDDIKIESDRVTTDGKVLFDDKALHIDGESLPLNEIYDSRLDRYDDHSVVTFFRKSGKSRALARIKRGNIILPDEDINIEEDEFVRGMIMSVTGNIEVSGEVNKDVISLFGNIYVGSEAVARGDIISIMGRVDISREASVYGEVYTGKDKQRHRYRHWGPRNQIDFLNGFGYDRVDGATLTGGLKYVDLDSLLPSVWGSIGYAFASERWRYKVGLEQVILRRPAIALGGEYYRRLASEDDWLLSDDENHAFTLLVTEDFKDYYEAEGGTVYLKLRPYSRLTIEGRYRLEETNWLGAHAHLFSLFGGDKLFRDNFSTVDSTFREIGIAELGSTTNSNLSASIKWDTRDADEPRRQSAWVTGANIEWSTPDLDSDFDYRRYTIDIRRYQKVNRRTTLLLRGMYGGSDGYLPMYKRFYVGGLGTLRGYKHKEFIGSRFWMTNAEYRIDFPRTDVAMSVLWDAAQITQDSKLSDSVEVKHSLGVAIYIGDDFRVSLAKRLDRSHDDNPKFYVRLTHDL